jgi:hypothetical protein
MHNYHHFIEHGKFENLQKYKNMILNFIKMYNQDVNLELFFNNLNVYLNKIHKEIIEERNIHSIEVCEKYSDYITAVLVKNKKIAKKDFKEFLISLAEQIDLRDGGEMINIQYKDLNVILFIHSNI